MNCKQNESISQVKVSNMVVGVDIGSTTHYARAFNWRGVELGRAFKFSNTHDGIESQIEWMRYLILIFMLLLLTVIAFYLILYTIK